MSELREPAPERELSTSQLFRHAIEETRLLARAEVEHAKLEVKAELREAMTAGIALGVGAVLAVCGLTLLFVAVAVALPMAEWGAALIVGGVLLLIAAISAAMGQRRLPKKPLRRTQQRLKKNAQLTRERYA